MKQRALTQAVKIYRIISRLTGPTASDDDGLESDLGMALAELVQLLPEGSRAAFDDRLRWLERDEAGETNPGRSGSVEQ